ncbi:MAG TPA: aminotransferase class IV [Acidimicrobiia bacterium]|nr:aminotransferase class IV [Acidimicrobiia bacterium]
MITFVDGVRQAAIAVTDSTVVRGDGVFEAVRSYGGRLFALDEHLARLAHSAAAMGIDLPDGERIGSWMRSAAAEGGDGVVRVIVSRGDVVPGASGEERVVVIHHRVPFTPSALRLRPWPAPWHPAGRPWELSGVKTTSYAPHQAATRSAGRDGFDDALLLTDDGAVLEGPTFGVLWIRGEVISAPALELGILDSITRRHVLRLAEEEGLAVDTGRFQLDDVLTADEVLAVSTVKEVTPVVSVGEQEFRPGPLTRNLASRFRDHVIATVRS